MCQIVTVVMYGHHLIIWQSIHARYEDSKQRRRKTRYTDKFTSWEFNLTGRFKLVWWDNIKIYLIEDSGVLKLVNYFIRWFYGTNKTGNYVLSYMNKCKFTKFGFKISYHTDITTLIKMLAYWSSPRGEVRQNFPLFHCDFPQILILHI